MWREEETKEDTPMSPEQNDQQAQDAASAWMTASINRLLRPLILFLSIFGWKYGPQANESFYNGLQYLCLVSLDFDSRSTVALLTSNKYNTRTKRITIAVREFLYEIPRLSFAILISFVSCLCESFRWGKRTRFRSCRISWLWSFLRWVSFRVFPSLTTWEPYAISQIAEQVIRVIWMLLTTFFIMRLAQVITRAGCDCSRPLQLLVVGASLLVLFYCKKTGLLYFYF